MRRLVFASTLFAALGSSVVASGQAHASDLVCIRTSKGKITCGSVIRHSDRTISKRQDRRQHIVPARSNDELRPSRRADRRTAYGDADRRFEDIVDPRFPGRRYRPDRNRSRHHNIENTDVESSQPHIDVANIRMPRRNPLRAEHPEAGRRNHPQRIMFKDASREQPARIDPRPEPGPAKPAQGRRDLNYSPVPPGRKASREEFLRSIDRVLSSEFGPTEQPPAEFGRNERPPLPPQRNEQPRARLERKQQLRPEFERKQTPSEFARKEPPPSEFARKEPPRRIAYPDLRPYRDDARQPDVRPDPRPDDAGKGPDQK